MKRIWLATASVFFFSCSFAVTGQTERATNAQPSCTVIAVIDSSKFGAEKDGIIRYVQAIKRLNVEFAHRFGHPTDREKRLKSLIDQMTMDGPKVTEAKIAEIDRLRAQVKQEREEREAIYQSDRKKVLEPVEQDIAKALKEFTNKRGIGLVLDVVETPGLMMVTRATDITDGFIAEFNSKYP